MWNLIVLAFRFYADKLSGYEMSAVSTFIVGGVIFVLWRGYRKGTMKPLTVFGLLGSAMWSIFLAFQIHSALGTTPAMTPNEWGDFLAGFVAPLFLLWLVIGYFQQGQELSLNTEALRAQQEELRQQVEATTLIGESTERHAQIVAEMSEREEIERKVAARPVFFVDTSQQRDGGKYLFFSIVNVGGTVKNLGFECEYGGTLEMSFPSSTWPNQRPNILRFDKMTGLPDSGTKFRISCTDQFNEQHECEFQFIPPRTIYEI